MAIGFLFLLGFGSVGVCGDDEPGGVQGRRFALADGQGAEQRGFEKCLMINV